MENNVFNPISMVDPENQSYLLLITFVDNDGDDSRLWIEFTNRKEVYTYIRDNLESDEVIIDINNSYIMMESEPYSSTTKTTVSNFMVVVAPIYGDTFNPNNYSIER